MGDLENRELANKEIELRRAMIARLEEEIKALRNPFIGEMVKGPIFSICPFDKLVRLESRCTISEEPWTTIVKLCILIHRGHYKKVLQKNLTREERELSAEMAEEVIAIWNKYVQRVYGFTVDMMVPSEFEWDDRPVYCFRGLEGGEMK